MKWYSVFCEKDCPNKICSRRLCGVLGFFAFIVGFFMGFPDSHMIAMASFSGALLGLTSFDKLKGKE